MNSRDRELQEFYDQMWRRSAPLLREGRVEVDPLLAAQATDARRGITLLAQPNLALCGKIGERMEMLRRIDGSQYFYRPEQYHLTVLSLFTATKDHARFADFLPDYLKAVHRAVQGIPSFQVHFRGVSASPGAVLIQGFPENDALELLRGRLRSELSEAGLAEDLDTRYRIVTAHITALRFRAPIANHALFLDALGRCRTVEFGMMQVSELSLVKHDWYVSAETKEVLANFRLRK